MPYSLEYMYKAERALARLDPQVARSIRQKLNRLAENAEALPHEALTGRYRGSFRIRIGDYRAIYDLDRTNRKISIDEIGHRREVYD